MNLSNLNIEQMKYPKLRELKEAITSLVTPAYTSKFPFQPHTPETSYRGKPVVNDDYCVGCETCANVCPSGAITVEDLVKKGPGSSAGFRQMYILRSVRRALHYKGRRKTF
jgi:formate hydrogenlyase subunit 6/NADH:ubiquinone oxidoreductase subunit I